MAFTDILNKVVKKSIDTAFDSTRWITVHPNGKEEKGRHLPLEDGETPKEAMKRQWGVDLDKKKGKTDKKEEKTTKEDKPSKSEARKKSDKFHEEYAKISDERKKAIKELNEEEEKLRKYARENKLGLYDAEKSYPDIEKYKKARDDYKRLSEERDEKLSSAVEYLSSTIRDTLKNYSKNTDALVADFDKIPDKVSEGLEEVKKLKEARDKIYDDKSLDTADRLGKLTENTILLNEQHFKNKKAKEEQIFENAKILGKDKTNFKLKYTTSSMKETGDKLNKVLDGFVGDGILKEEDVVNIKKLRSGGRAYEKLGAINVDAKGGLEVAIHEYAHFIEERNPRVLMNSLAFAKMRTEGEKTQTLAKLTGNRGYKGEYAKKDNFFNPYCGKVYAMDTDKYNKATASEIMSMGMERLFTEPKKFAKEDREYFDFVIANIKGDI